MSAHVLQQKTGGAVQSQQAGNDGRGDGQAQNGQSFHAEYTVDAVEDGQSGQSVKSSLVSHVFRPRGIFGRNRHNAHGRQQDVDKPAREHGGNDDGEQLPGRKIKIIAGMRNGLKTEKHPGSQHAHGQDLRDGGCIRLEQGIKNFCTGLLKERRKQNHHSEQENYCQNGVQMFIQAAAVADEQTKEEENCPGGGNLAKINIKIGDGVKIAPFKNIAQKVAGQKHIGGGVGPENRHIGDEQNPRRQKSMVAA